MGQALSSVSPVNSSVIPTLHMKQFNEWTELSEDTNRNRFIFLFPRLPACSDGPPSFTF